MDRRLKKPLCRMLCRTLCRTLCCMLCCMLCCGLLLPLGGCRGGSYGSITPHLEQRLDLSEPGDLTVSNYTALHSAVLRLVEQGASEGVIRMTDYLGDAQSDVLSACRQVQTSEPLGVYLVEYMSYECVRVLASYEARISITYRRSPEQIASIREIGSAAAFRGALAETVASYGSSLVTDVRYYYAEQYDAPLLCDDLLLADPLRYVATPEVSTQVYPDGPAAGWNRILDITLHWGMSSEALEARREELAETAAELTVLPEESDPKRVLTLIELASERISPASDLADPDADTSYGALVRGRATSRGVACGFAVLCETAGYEWRIVSGMLAGDPHCWNMIRVDGNWYHLDLTAAAPACLTNDELPAGYAWDVLRYPICNGAPLLPEPEPEPAEPPVSGEEGEASEPGEETGELEPGEETGEAGGELEPGEETGPIETAAPDVEPAPAEGPGPSEETIEASGPAEESETNEGPLN